MAVTSQIARIRVGPNARNKTTLYTLQQKLLVLQATPHNIQHRLYNTVMQKEVMV